jgi:hypothetical protein
MGFDARYHAREEVPVGTLNAKTTLLKSQYFLKQARIAQADPQILADRLPFAANLEAAIIYARSAVDHLRNELAPMHRSKGYGRWHDNHWKALCKLDPVCDYFVNRRNFIVHQEPEKTHAQISLGPIQMSAQASVSVSVAVVRATGTTEPDQPANVDAKQKASSVQNNSPEQPKPSSQASQQFFFADSAWRGEPAVTYVGEFIAAIQEFISDAEAKFNS